MMGYGLTEQRITLCVCDVFHASLCSVILWCMLVHVTPSWLSLAQTGMDTTGSVFSNNSVIADVQKPPFLRLPLG